MDNLIFALNAVLPLVLLIMLGVFLKKIGLLNDEFLKTGNKLTFRVLLPCLLFCNIYKIESFDEINVAFIAYAMAAVVVLFSLAMLSARLFVKENARRGVVVQGLFRSNYALIGIPLATSLFGETGAAAASVLSAFCVPMFNALAVIALSVFSDDEKRKANIGGILLGILKNPLIIGIFSGLVVLALRTLFVSEGIMFRLENVAFFYEALTLLSKTATPLALIILGGTFSFSATGKMWKTVLAVSLLRTIVVPSAVLAGAYFFVPNLSGEHFATYIAAFGTPVAVSSAIMAKEMGADEQLASQLVVWTTVLSSVTLVLQIAVCRAIGVL